MMELETGDLLDVCTSLLYLPAVLLQCVPLCTPSDNRSMTVRSGRPDVFIVSHRCSRRERTKALPVVKCNSHFVLAVVVDRLPSPSLVPFSIPFLCHIFGVVVLARADISLRRGAGAALRSLRRGGVFHHVRREQAVCCRQSGFTDVQ